jgi:pyruvate formate lyase activating enzyme
MEKMGICKLCGFNSSEIPASLSLCKDCIRGRKEHIISNISETHSKWRRRIGLRESIPKDPEGLPCNICVNNCTIKQNSSGFCGIIWNIDNRLTYISGDYNLGYLHWYLDPHPTNCVAAHICPATTDAGYPVYTFVRGPEYGCYNLAIFFAGCNLDCIFCQNIEHKYLLTDVKIGRDRKKYYSIDDILKVGKDEKITCICYFGGDPTPHSVYSIRLSREFVRMSKDNNTLKRICWETNGLENPRIIEEMVRLSLASGGIVKIDWKAYSPSIYSALTGIDGEKAVERIFQNINIISKYIDERREVPILVVSSLIVPHYIDEEEIYSIAKFLASIDNEIPYVLLAFAPHHLMREVPTTSRIQMENVYKAAKDAGLKRVFIGNIWLLR